MKKQAFTLIELLIIMAVVGVLSTVVMTNIGNARAKALNAKRANDLDTIYKALKLYYTNENNKVPDATCKIGEPGCLTELVTRGYIKDLPLGPNGKCSSDVAPEDPRGECYFYIFDPSWETQEYAILYTTMVPSQSGPFRLGQCAPSSWLGSRYCVGFKSN